MSRCRASSFYVAPGQYRSFDEWAVFTKVDGAWFRVTHRRDIERLSDGNGWDGVCFMFRRSPADRAGQVRSDIDGMLVERPEDVELWSLDARTVNGRPSGLSHHLHTVARRGTVRAGGTREAVGRVIGATPAGKMVAAWFAETPLESTGEAAALKLLAAASTILDDAAMQSLVAAMRRSQPFGPMPVFDTAAIASLSFLARYQPARQVSLLADLWRSHVDTTFSATVRVATEVRRRGGPARTKADAVLTDALRSDVDRTVRLIASRSISFTDVAEHLPVDVIETLAQQRKHRHLVAFHPLCSDPAVAQAVFADRSRFEEEIFPDFTGMGPLAPAVADVVASELSKVVRHTHSSVKSRNTLMLAARLAEQDPAHNHLFVAAFTSYLRTRDAASTYHLHDLDEVFSDRLFRFDRRSCEVLFKHHLEHARRHVERARTRGVSWPGRSRKQDDWTSAALLASLEAQQSAPPAIKKQAQETLASRGFVHRGDDGVVRTWSRHLRRCVDSGTLSTATVDAMFDIEWTRDERKLATLVYEFAASPVDDEVFEHALSAWGRLVELLPPLSRWERETTLQARNRVVVDARSLRRLVNGVPTPSDLDALSKPSVMYTVEDRAQMLTAEQRALMLEHSRDADVATVGFILSGDVDVISSEERDMISREVQLRVLLADNAAVEWPVRPKRFEELPTADFLPWDLAPIAAALDGRRVMCDDEPYDVKVISTIQDLRANAAPNAMGNCTASYAVEIRTGRTVILAVGRGGATEINVSVILEGDRWVVSEVKGRQNRRLPEEFERSLTDQIMSLIA